MIASGTPHSADVELWLHCEGKRYELGQVGGGIVILRKAESIPGGEAVIETIIDGQSDRFPIGTIPAQTGESKRIQFDSPDAGAQPAN